MDTVLEPLFFGMLNTSEDGREDLFRQKKWDSSLLKEFGRIPYLNGGLFEADDLDKIKIKFPKEMFSNPHKSEVERKFNDKADYTNKPYPFTESCGLLDFFARYNFTIDETDPSDMEIGVDPEMLGKIFENLLEDNKDKGAFYTPKEIVQYMCRESLIAYLSGQLTDSSGQGSENSRQITEYSEKRIGEGNEKLRGFDCLAEGDGFDGGNLQTDETLAERRTLFTARPNEKSGSVDSIEHSGRLRSQQFERISSVSTDSERLSNGTGYSAKNLRENKLSNSGTDKRLFGNAGTDSKNDLFVNEQFANNREQLTDNSEQLTDNSEQLTDSSEQKSVDSKQNCKLRIFVEHHDASAFTEDEKSALLRALKEVKICDPAVGSGAFPMGMLNELYACRVALGETDYSEQNTDYSEQNTDYSEQITGNSEQITDYSEQITGNSEQITGNSEQITVNSEQNCELITDNCKLFTDNCKLNIKKQIVKNNIYGVDIEKGAVDIARLRFWLAIIVDEDEPIPLPNLDYKIMQGNSLLESYKGIDLSNLTAEKKKDAETDLFGKPLSPFQSLNFDDESDIVALLGFLKDYFDKHESKSAIREAIKASVLDLIKKRGVDNSTFDDLSKLDLHENSEFFLWHTWFYDVFSRPQKEGFDIVIGNPPYIKEYENKSAFDGFRETSPYYMGKMDLWYGFACTALDLLAQNGHLCFIAQNNWTTSSGAKKMRNKVISDSKICQMLDFNDYMVFESASIQTMIMLFEKNSKQDDYSFDYRVLNANSKKQDMLDLLNKIKTPQTRFLEPKIVRTNYKDKLLTFSENDSIFEKIADGKVYLDEKEIAQGIVFPQDFLNNKCAKILGSPFKIGDSVFGLTSEKLKSLHLSTKENNLIKPYYTSEQIGRYYVNPKNELWLIYTNSSFKNEHSLDDYPNIKKHLDQFRKIFTSDNKPYGLHRAREEHFFKGEKIISQRKCVGNPIFAYCDFDTYVTQTYFVIQTSRWNMKFLTAILNSKLIAFWLKNKGKMQGENYQVDKEPLLSIPLPSPDSIPEEIQNKIIALVDKIIESKSLRQAQPTMFPGSAVNSSTSEAGTSDFEKQIDDCVFDLYGLLQGERNFIIGKV